MTLITRHVTLNSKVYSAPSSLALLLLLAWSSSAIGATAMETRCDQSVRAKDMPDTRPASLSIEVAEHRTPEIPIDTDELGPDMEILLRRAFDSPTLRPVNRSESEDVDEMAAPLAVDQGDTVEEAASKAESEDARKTSAGLPGVSQDDLLRFKRQMYRKDI